MFSEFLKRYRYLFVVFLIGIVIGCDNAQNHIDIGDKLVLEDKTDKAIEEYKQAIDIDKNIAEVFINWESLFP
jgi:translation initiation factor 2 alpha subunit (eIF-2alpha)